MLRQIFIFSILTSSIFALPLRDHSPLARSKRCTPANNCCCSNPCSAPAPAAPACPEPCPTPAPAAPECQDPCQGSQQAAESGCGATNQASDLCSLCNSGNAQNSGCGNENSASSDGCGCGQQEQGCGQQDPCATQDPCAGGGEATTSAPSSEEEESSYKYGYDCSTIKLDAQWLGAIACCGLNVCG